jgi:hypothetical protein
MFECRGYIEIVGRSTNFDVFNSNLLSFKKILVFFLTKAKDSLKKHFERRDRIYPTNYIVF